MYNDNKRLALSLFWLLLGAVLLGLSLAGRLDSELYSGLGGALMGVGALQLLRTARYRRNPDYREKVDTQNIDERNRFLRMKSWSWTGYLILIAEAVGAVIALILGKQDLQQMLSYQVCLMLTVYWVTYLILSRKY